MNFAFKICEISGKYNYIFHYLYKNVLLISKKLFISNHPHLQIKTIVANFASTINHFLNPFSYGQSFYNRKDSNTCRRRTV